MRFVPACLASLLLACSGEDAPRAREEADAAVPKPDAALARDATTDAARDAAVDARVDAAQDASSADATVSKVDWSACIPGSTHILGMLDGKPVDLVRQNNSHVLGFFGFSFNIGEDPLTFYSGARVSVSVVDVSTAGRALEVTQARVQLEGSDPFADRELCDDTTTEAYKEGDKLFVRMKRVASLKCPGAPVSGRLVLADQLLNGTLGTHAFRDEPTSQSACKQTEWSEPEGCQNVSTTDYTQLDLVTSEELSSMGGRGIIAGGRIAFRDDTRRELDIYCVGGGAAYTRAADNLEDMKVTLESFTRVGGCADNQALGELTLCIQDSALLDF